MKKLFALVATLKASANLASARLCAQCRRRLTRGLFVLGASVLILIQASGIATAAAPINDRFSAPTGISALPYSDAGRTTEATTEAGERGCTMYKTVWYKFRFTSEVNVTAKTSHSRFDTVLAAYEDTGGGLAGLVRVACDQVMGESKINWLATANKTYYIQLGGWDPHYLGGDGPANGGVFSFEVVAETAQFILSINDVTVTEGNAGTTNAVFTVTKAGTADATCTVDFATRDGTAREPSDYTQVSGTLTFAPGDATKKVAVVVNGDTDYEKYDEYFYVALSDATNATIPAGSAGSAGQGTIKNDDAAPTGSPSPPPATTQQPSPKPHSSSSPGAAGGGSLPGATGSGQTGENLPSATGANKAIKNLASAAGVNRIGKDLPDAPRAEASESPSPLIRAQGKSSSDKATIAFIAVIAAAGAWLSLWKLRRT